MFISNMNLIGLEYYAVRFVVKDARARREFLQDAVSDIQHENDMLDEDVAEELRDSCRSITRTSRLFAQYLARAQQTDHVMKW